MNRIKDQKKYIRTLLIILTIITVGIGYAALTQKLTIDGNISYGTMKWDVGYKTAVDGGGTISSNPVISSDKKKVTITCNLGTSTNPETCIVDAEISNGSTFNVQLAERLKTTFDRTYIESVTTVWKDNSENVIALDTIAANTSKYVRITIKTKELVNEIIPTEALELPVTIEMNWTEEGKTEQSKILLTRDNFINGCHYNDGTLKLGDPYSKLLTTNDFIEPQKVKLTIEDPENDVTTQHYKVVYSAYDESGKILNPGDTENAMFNITTGEITLDLPTLYPSAAKFRLDIFRYNAAEFSEIPSTAIITVSKME